MGWSNAGDTYEDWVEWCTTPDNNTQWAGVGSWLWPKSNNKSYSDQVVHYCRAYYDTRGEGTRNYMKLTGTSCQPCHYCGVEVPDGIKILALLEKM